MIEITGYQAYDPIQDRINENNHTALFRSIRSADGMPVILKTPRTEYPSDSVIARFQHEYDILRALDGSGAPKAYDLFKCHNAPVLVMANFPGDSLVSWLHRVPFDLKARVRLAVRICECLAEIHDRDVIHRDINPSNMLINPQTLEVKLTDVALSTRFARERQEAVQASQLEGTLAYLSPEQTGRMNRPVDYRTDLYAFGATLYELLTGEVPFPGKDPLELVHAHIARKPIAPSEKRPEVPEALSRIALKCLAKNAEDRYQSASGIQRDLEQCLEMWAETGQVQSFPLGQRDRARQLNVSRKLYGRENERSVIQEAFHRAGHGTTELVLISGPEGSGKSALLAESVELWQEETSFLCKGAFSPFQQSVPYAGLREALGQLASAMQELPNEKMSAWETQIRSTLGGNTGLLTSLVPYLEQLTDSIPGSPASGPSEAKDQLKSTLRNFLSLFGDVNRPLVLCLDDLQWADADTLDLLQSTLCEGPTPYLLVIGTYRGQQLSDARPLVPFHDALGSAPVGVSELPLSYLNSADVSSFLSESLQLQEEEVSELAELLVSKTHGSPFFLHYVLVDLYKTKRLSYNIARDRWVWNWNSIEEMDVTTNVVDFTIGRIGALSETGRKLLMQAACIGDRFNLELLAKVRDQDVQTVFIDVDETIQEGLVERVRTTMTASARSAASMMDDGFAFRFVHPRVRQAAYEHMPPVERQRTHLRIAEFLATVLTQAEREQRPYELADHFLAAVDLLTTAGQRIAAAKAFLIAGKKSQETAAFETGLRYFRAGTALLPADAWNHQYDLAFPLHFEQMASEFACGHYERTLELTRFLRAHAESTRDQLEVIWIRMAVYVVLDQLSEVRRLGVDSLHLCGIQLPRIVSRRAAAHQYQLVKELIGARTADEVALLPNLTDPMIHQSIRMLAMISNGTDDVTKAFFLFKIAELSLRHGLVAESAVGFFGSGSFMQIDRKRDLDEAYELGLIGLKISERFQDVQSKANTFGYFTTYLNHWRHHLKTSLKLEETYEELMSSLSTRKGYAIMYSPVSSYLRLACGDVLGDILGQAGEFLLLAEAHDMRFATILLHLLLGTSHALQGSSNESMEMDERSILSEIEYGKQDIILAQSYLACMQLYILDRAEEALAPALEGFNWMTMRTEALDFLFPEQTFYHALILTSVYPKAKEIERIEYRTRLQRSLRLMRMWAKGCPDNYLHKYLLLQAEYMRLFGKGHKAADLYDEAISSAKEYGFLQNEAIANECAARFYLAQDKARVGRAYLNEARFLYGQWGALGKVQQLEVKYSHLLERTGAADSVRVSPSPTGSELARQSERRLQSLDLSTILKTSQAISSEIQLDKLLSTMLSLVIENAGAEKGYWILQHDGEWSVTASADVNGHSQEMPSASILDTDRVSFGVVQYTIRTQEVVVLHNACREGRFVRDPYIRRTKAKSILCFPLVKHGNVTAILYLENNLATHAFTAERVGLLKLLSGQAAISIENARMYASLDQLVQERTDELRRAQQKMIESEKMASLGQLTAGVAHEINNPINFVVSSLGPLRRDIDDLMQLLNMYQCTVEEQRLHSHFEKLKSLEEKMDLSYVTEEIKQLLRGIDEGGKRTAEIVKGLRTFSRLDEDEVKKASVTEGIDSTLTLLRKKLESRIRIILDYDDIPDIECYPGKLNQVYMNLLSNAIEAIPEEGEIRISAKQVGDCVRIRISDSGAGMSKEVIRRVFEPFFTTKEVGVGTGLGLSISYGIIDRHKGSIEVDSEPGKGTTFTITLPIRQTDVSTLESGSKWEGRRHDENR